MNDSNQPNSPADNDSLSLRHGHLYLEGCDVVALAAEFRTPLFVISETQLRNNLGRYKRTFESFWPEGRVRIMPAFKASPLIAIRRVLSREGCGCDVFGPGELEGALHGGVIPSEISVNGSIKDRQMIRKAIEVGARIVLDSPRELELCQEEAVAQDRMARVMFRVKPFLAELDVPSDFLPDAEIRELTQLIKYGVPTSELLPMGARSLALTHVQPVGVHAHMGRHSKHLEVWQSWVAHCVALTKRLSDEMDGWRPQEINLGGGFPSASDRDTDVAVQGYEGPTLAGYAKTITETLRSSLAEAGMDSEGITLEVEPGRGLHGDTGVHLTSVKNVKEETEHRPRKWAELDTSEVFLGVSGLNDSPPFDFIVANKADRATEITTDMVGMTCNAELLFNQVSTPRLEEGDVVALLNTGSYIEPMAANFNALPRPGTVLVVGDTAEMIKRHETVAEVFSRDTVPQRLRDGAAQ